MGFKHWKSPLGHKKSKAACADMYAVGTVRAPVRESPQRPAADLLVIVFVVTIIGKRMCLPIEAGGLQQEPCVEGMGTRVSGDLSGEASEPHH